MKKNTVNRTCLELSVRLPRKGFHYMHYSDVIMDTMASTITSRTIVYSTINSGADQRKHQNQSSASLAFVRGIHRWPVNSPHKGPVTRKMFSFDDVIMWRPFFKSSEAYIRGTFAQEKNEKLLDELSYTFRNFTFKIFRCICSPLWYPRIAYVFVKYFDTRKLCPLSAHC